jgi:nucleoside-diphosphate-sugar epimerase
MTHVLVVGGAGYVGCSLVPKLLNVGLHVTVFDALFFGDHGLPKGQPRLKVIQGDIRDIDAYSNAVAGKDAVIHLACISNDPSFELDRNLSKSINFDSFEPLVVASRNAGVGRFIYASTSSVYGVSDSPDVTEDHPLVPLTDYNKYKGLSEPHLLKHQSDGFTTVIIRPATVCGYSPRMRLDLSVNILTNHAVNKGRITVFGGKQMRPNIHIEDIAELYVDLLTTPKHLIAGEIFNAGFENHTIADLAILVKEVVEQECPEKRPISIDTTPSNDNRSYHVSSTKITRKLGYRPKRTVRDAVRDMAKAFKADKLPNSLEDPIYFNVQMIKKACVR